MPAILKCTQFYFSHKRVKTLILIRTLILIIKFCSLSYYDLNYIAKVCVKNWMRFKDISEKYLGVIDQPCIFSYISLIVKMQT